MIMYGAIILIYVFLLIGFWNLFGKLDMNKKIAFIPGYRFYALADRFDMDEEGITLMNVLIANEICSIVSTFLSRREGFHYHANTIIIVLSAIFLMTEYIFRYRIGNRLCTKIQGAEKHGKWWRICWIFLPVIPICFWGIKEKYRPISEIHVGMDAADTTGVEEKVLGKGLTINLKERSVKQHLKKKYLLRDIHMNITPNKMVLLLGGSGAGKTTFLNAITGYEKADAVITLNGEDVYKNFNHMKYEIGFVPQQDLIRYEDTVQRTLQDAAALRLPTDVTAKERAERVNEVINIFGLNPVRNNLVVKQSGGQKKRISIASEFISNPTLFILDEPDSGLDGILARELMQRLHDISRQEKIVIVITHTPDRVIDLFDEVIVLGKDANRTGRLVFHGSIEKARDFFRVEKMEEIIRKINCVDEGGEGLSDELIEKFEEVRHGK